MKKRIFSKFHNQNNQRSFIHEQEQSNSPNGNHPIFDKSIQNSYFNKKMNSQQKKSKINEIYNKLEHRL